MLMNTDPDAETKESMVATVNLRVDKEFSRSLLSASTRLTASFPPRWEILVSS